MNFSLINIFFAKAKSLFDADLKGKLLVAQKELDVLREQVGNFQREKRRNLKDIVLMQYEFLKKQFVANNDTLVIMLFPGAGNVAGGILSCASIYSETKQILSNYADTIACCVPTEEYHYRNHFFYNQIPIYHYRAVRTLLKRYSRILVHIPAYYARNEYDSLCKVVSPSLKELFKSKETIFNLMLQNIDNIPTPSQWKSFAEFGKLTITTAHDRYTTEEIAKKYKSDLYMLSVFATQELYNKKRFSDKENILLVSIDEHPRKGAILNKIKNSIPDLKIIEIRNMPYRRVKKLYERAKWSLTFGEGLDFYFVEEIFSGGIGFSVWNERFFMPDFKGLPTVYDSYDDMEERIVQDLSLINKESVHEKINNELVKICSKYYYKEKYINNIKKYYSEVLGLSL